MTVDDTHLLDSRNQCCHTLQNGGAIIRLLAPTITKLLTYKTRLDQPVAQKMGKRTQLISN